MSKIAGSIKAVAVKNFDSQSINPIELIKEIDEYIAKLKAQIRQQKLYSDDLNIECMKLIEEIERLRLKNTKIEDNCRGLIDQLRKLMKKLDKLRQELKKAKGLQT
jgi:predicted nuclease with TOPRIM domain